MLRYFNRLALIGLLTVILCYLSGTTYANPKAATTTSGNKDARDIQLYAESAILRPKTSFEADRALNDNDYDLSFYSLIGKKRNRFQFLIEQTKSDRESGTDGDVDLFYWRLVNPRWAIKAGGKFVFDSEEPSYFQPGVGVEGTLPFYINADLRMYIRKGSLKIHLDFNRTTQMYKKLFFDVSFKIMWATKEVFVDTVGTGLNEIKLAMRPYYVVNHWISIYLAYEYDQYIGSTKVLERKSGYETSNNDIKLGITVSF